MPAVKEETLSAEDRRMIDRVVAAHRGRPGELLGVLEVVQAANAHKYLPQEMLRYIATATGAPPAQVYSMATFYSLFNLEPQGDNLICVCRGTACHTRGSRHLLEKLCLDVGLNEHQTGETPESDKLSLTSADNRFTIRTVACFGQCALAPVVEVNHHILSHVNERTLVREVKGLAERRG